MLFVLEYWKHFFSIESYPGNIRKRIFSTSSYPGNIGQLIFSIFSCPGNVGKLIFSIFSYPGHMGKRIFSIFCYPGNIGSWGLQHSLSPGSIGKRFFSSFSHPGNIGNLSFPIVSYPGNILEIWVFQFSRILEVLESLCFSIFLPSWKYGRRAGSSSGQVLPAWILFETLFLEICDMSNLRI